MRDRGAGLHGQLSTWHLTFRAQKESGGTDLDLILILLFRRLRTGKRFENNVPGGGQPGRPPCAVRGHSPGVHRIRTWKKGDGAHSKGVSPREAPVTWKQHSQNPQLQNAGGDPR